MHIIFARTGENSEMARLSFKSLASFFGKEKLDFKLIEPHEYAHLVIDVQRQFCDPSYSVSGTKTTDNIARGIARLTPLFREAGIPTYMIYKQRWSEPSEQAWGGFHRVKPAKGDVVFGKHMHSAFEYTDLGDQLRARGIKTLLVSGFDIECCINASVQDALREDFNVWVLKDCIGNGGRQMPGYLEGYFKLMTDNGAELMHSSEAVRRLQQPKPL